MKEFLEGMERSKSIIIESRLGNGKTVFLYLAFLALAERGYTCFLFRSAGPTIDLELNALTGIAKPVILFDEYAGAQDTIQKIAERLPKAKFIVEIRTSIFEVRFHEISENIPGPYTRVGLNRLTRSDILAFERLCTGAGIPTTKLSRGRSNVEMRELLLEVLDSPNIKQKIETTIRPLFGGVSKRKVLVFTMLLGRFHLSVNAGFIRTVTGIDPYHEFRPVREIADELFETGVEDFRVRSAVFADFAVKHFLKADEIADCIVDAAVTAASRKNDRVYRVLMGNLMQYSNLIDLFHDKVDANGLIIRLYERLRYDERINDEPLFWLQYAIAVTEANQLLAAEQFIQTSYDRAAARTGFRTFQIDTQAFRILLLIELGTSAGNPVARIQQILDKLEMINSMLSEESHRHFAIRVLEGIGPFIQKRRKDLTVAEKTALTFWLSKVIETLGALPIEYRARAGSDETKTKVEIAKQNLLD